MVTGATGYVAGVLVKTLLEAGLTVHAPVRSPSDVDKLKYLNEIANNTLGSIKFFQADLLNEGSYDLAMKGCEIVFHTASPFKINVKDAQKELVDPALLGTENVLKSVNRSNTVCRVVLTSSCAAIYGDNADLRTTKSNKFTEDDWNATSTLQHQPYSYSKTLAEKKAWEMNGKQSRWELVVVNPSFVIGPGINPFGTSESFNLISQMGDGTMKAGAPSLATGVVDVRDLAQAHYNAAFSKQAKGRYIISGHNTDIISLANTLQSAFGEDFPLPSKVLPKWLLWLVGPMVDKAMTRKVVSLNIGFPWVADNQKSVSDLNMVYRPLHETMNEFFQQLVDAKRF